jgi:hemoglobin-like flavoprotein
MSGYITIINESYNRSIRNDVIGLFYDIFLKSHPDIAPLFSKTDFDVQKTLLKHSVLLAIMFVEGISVGDPGIKRIRESHGKTGMNIPPELYPYWKTSFIQAISESDPEYSEQIQDAWDSVLQETIDYITEGYEAN